MPAQPRDVVPTRSALLDLQAEARFTREGHELLDQKRMLLAAEIQRWLSRCDAAHGTFAAAHGAARVALAEAAARHGIDRLAVYPAGQLSFATVTLATAGFLGVPIVGRRGEPVAAPAATKAESPSPEARRAASAGEALLREALELSIVEGNLRRLLDEYRRTERRARALENVILPELSATVQRVEERLEEQEQEELGRIRRHRRPV